MFFIANEKQVLVGDEEKRILIDLIKGNAIKRRLENGESIPVTLKEIQEIVAGFKEILDSSSNQSKDGNRVSLLDSVTPEKVLNGLNKVLNNKKDNGKLINCEILKCR